MGNQTFSTDDLDSPNGLFCSAGFFEAHRSTTLDHLQIYKYAQWNQQYVSVVRGLCPLGVGDAPFNRWLAGFLTAASKYSYFHYYDSYVCDDPGPGSQLIYRPEYGRPLGDPGEMVMHTHVEWENGTRAPAPDCNCYVSDYAHDSPQPGWLNTSDNLPPWNANGQDERLRVCFLALVRHGYKRHAHVL
jgi:hypothetical protein